MEMKGNMIERERNNLYLFTFGKAISILGSTIYTFAIGLYVLKMTGSALNYATTLILSVVPMIVISPIAGVIADRIPKKYLVVGMDLINGCLFTLLYFHTSKKMLNLEHIYLTTILLHIFTTIFGIAIESAKPSLVTTHQLIRLNSLSKLIDSAASILGPVIGGVVFVMMDIRILILVNAISFIFSAVIEWFIDFHLNEDDMKESKIVRWTLKDFFLDLKEGWVYFSNQRSILKLFFVFVSLNFLLGFSVNVPAPYIINQVLKMPSSSFGIINGLFPVGLIIGTLTVEKVMKRVAFQKLLVTTHAFIALLAGMIGLPIVLNFSHINNLFFYSTLNILMGIAIAYVDVPIMTLLQKEIPRILLGRVLSLMMSLVKIVLPISLIISGLLIEKINVEIIPVMGSTVALLLSAVVFKKGR
ncbi:MAG: MFS transporter, partial [Tissierellales bacterium]|nr:MFS transporter [Tissierellales bacterium]